MKEVNVNTPAMVKTTTSMATAIISEKTRIVKFDYNSPENVSGNYWILKLIGRLKKHLTDLPVILAAFHFGMDFTTRMASRSQSEHPGTPFKTSTLLISPVSFTTNFKKHLPLMPASRAIAGY